MNMNCTQYFIQLYYTQLLSPQVQFNVFFLHKAKRLKFEVVELISPSLLIYVKDGRL